MNRFPLMSNLIAVFMLVMATGSLCMAQDTASDVETKPATATTSTLDPLSMSLDVLRIRIAPLNMEELEPLREKVMTALHKQATKLADKLVEKRNLEQTTGADPAELAAIDEALVQLVEEKTELVNRANVILTAIEQKGANVTSGRAYVSAIDVLQHETIHEEKSQEDLPEDERKAQTTRARVAELVAVVRSEPPAHERPHPWEISVSELELEMQPLRLEQIEERLKAWQEILQREVRKRIRLDILLNDTEKLTSVQAAREEAMKLAGIATEDADEITIDELKSELAEQSQAQQAIIRMIVERMEATITLVQMRGGDPKVYVDYIASATGQKLNLYDPTVLYAQVRAWLASRDGGLKIVLSILKFLGVLVGFWIVSVIVGWITRSAIKRVPNTSSLLGPLLVTTVKRLIMLVGLIAAVSMLGVSVGPLLAMIGAAGLVVGLALQGTLSNFASGILILLNKPYDVGDVIDAGGVVGKVEAMNLVSTRVLTFDNQIMFVPNNQIWNGVITNVTGLATRRVDMMFGIGYSDDVSKAVSILEEMLKNHPKVLADPEPVVRVHEHGDNSVNLIARPWARTADYWDVYWDLMRDVKLRFDKDGINIPFPQRDLHIPGAIEVKLAEK